MQREITIGPFTATVTNQSIKIGGLDFTPGQKDSLIGVLGFTENLIKSNAMPPTVGVPPFRVEFDEDGNHLLFRTDVDGDLVFTEESLNDLFEVVNMAYDIAIDLIKITPRAVGRLPNYKGGDTFDGAA